MRMREFGSANRLPFVPAASRTAAAEAAEAVPSKFEEEFVQQVFGTGGLV